MKKPVHVGADEIRREMATNPPTTIPRARAILRRTRRLYARAIAELGPVVTLTRTTATRKA